MALSRSGANNGDLSDVRSLYLKKFSGEVLAALMETYVVNDFTMKRTVAEGREWQFPVFGRAESEFFVHNGDPDNEVFGQALNVGERTITLDNMKIAAVEIADIDTMLEHFDSRAIWTGEIANAIRRHEERLTQYTLWRTAQTPGVLDELPGGTEFEVASGATTVEDVTEADILEALFRAGEVLDRNEVSEMERYALMTPDLTRKLIEGRTALNADWNGSGSFARGVLGQINGINIVKSNRMYRDNVATNPVGAINPYTGDFRRCLFPVFHKSATGTLMRKDLAISADWDYRRHTWLVQAMNLSGHGTLRPEAVAVARLAAA